MTEIIGWEARYQGPLGTVAEYILASAHATLTIKLTNGARSDSVRVSCELYAHPLASWKRGKAPAREELKSYLSVGRAKRAAAKAGSSLHNIPYGTTEALLRGRVDLANAIRLDERLGNSWKVLDGAVEEERYANRIAAYESESAAAERLILEAKAAHEAKEHALAFADEGYGIF
jgi:hypothetical protein